ncbi:MAG: hypothetical protein U1F58_11345 [Burkholderiales bacterium]
MTELTLLQPGDPIDRITGPVGMLFECAPDSQARRSHPGAAALGELIGDFDTVKRRASGLAARLLAGEPSLRGIGQLAVFEEVVIRELQFALHALHLRRQLGVMGVRRCRFMRTSRLAQALADLRRRGELDVEIDAPAEPGRSTVVRSLANSARRLRHSRFSGAACRAELRLVLDRIDPFHRRRALLPRGAHRRGGLWFYGTAYTYTTIGLLYEPHFPTPFEFLVENAMTGGRALRERGRPFVSVYEFASWADAPKAGEARDAAAALIAHVEGVPLEGDEALARSVFVRGAFMHTFLRRLLPSGLFATALFDRWVATVRPDAVIVGNPVFEAYALHAARRRGIPTVLLQHGILGDFCQFIDPPVDHYVVRGEFWKDFLAPEARRRACVLDPSPAIAAPRAAPTDRASVVFISTPYALQEFLDGRDLDAILAVLVAAAKEAGRELVIRVHPLEQVAHYRTRVRGLLEGMSAAPEVSYSQGPGLDDVLGRAAVAVTLSSTVFLDCLRHRVPIVSFAWHDFSFRAQIERWGVFRFAPDLSQLKQLVADAIDGRLAPYAKSTEPFLAATPADALRAGLARLTRPCGRE